MADEYSSYGGRIYTLTFVPDTDSRYSYALNFSDERNDLLRVTIEKRYSTEIESTGIEDKEEEEEDEEEDVVEDVVSITIPNNERDRFVAFLQQVINMIRTR